MDNNVGKALTVGEDVDNRTQVRKTKITTPWRPPKLLNVKHREKGFRYRWASEDSLDGYLDSGWEVVIQSARKKEMAPSVTLLDGSRITGVIRKRELILIRIPEETAQEIDEHYRNLTRQKTRSHEEEFKKQASINGAGYYEGK